MQTKPSTMRKRRKLEECSSTRVSKRRAKKEEKEEKEEEHENEVDIISNLPEHILHYMFSFVDMKQVIQTCILSRRWRYFWVSLPNLKFSYNKSNRKTIRNKFIDFVDRVLMFRSNPSSIDEFTLVTNRNVIDVTDRLNTWILASVIRNVQQLTIHTNFPKNFRFHHSLFTCKSLTKLVVGAIYKRVSFSLPDSITLPRLKTLSLSSVQFEDEDSTNQFFSSCPILESLTIQDCEFPHINVNISSPKLQHLVIENCSRNHRSNALDLGPVLETNFQLCAPNLKSFVWNNNKAMHCDPKNLSSLVKAADISTYVYEDSNLSKENAPFMLNILRELHNVEDLTLSAAFLKIVTGAPYCLDSQPTKFSNLKCLKLEGHWRSVDCIHAISYLLKITPNIETLFVKVHYGAPDWLEVQPTQCFNLRCLKMNTLLSRDCIYAIAYFLKISLKIENLSFEVSSSFLQMPPFWNPDEITSNSAKRGDYWKAGLSLEGLLNHLKCFELSNVTGLINELEFIEILLKNAVLLEKLLIFFHPDYSKVGRLAKFREKVLTFPRVSSSVVIIFKFGN